MKPYYPQYVEPVKTTNRGLSNEAQFAYQHAMQTEKTEYAEIGARLTRIRKAYSDLSQKAWAHKHGFSDTQYNNWERGIRRITVDEAERLCDAYGVTLDFIYRGRRDGLSETSSKIL